MDRFEKAFLHILEIETGIYTNRPSDRGGPTRYGITLLTLSEYRGKVCTAQDVKNLTENEAKKIYRQNYWIEGLPVGIDLALFDQAVNRGKVTAIITLQRSLGVKIDGFLGPVTKAVAVSKDPRFLIWDFLKESYVAYARIVQTDSSQTANIAGWLNRVNSLTERLVVDPREE